MDIINLTKDNFDTELNNSSIMFVDFWGEWCAPCKVFGTIFEKVASTYPDISFCKINIEEEPELAADFNVNSIPHLLVLKEDIAIFSESGSMPESSLVDLVKQAQDADISVIKNEIKQSENSD